MREPGSHCCRLSTRTVIGIDEVGRGCIAGRVTAAAVMFHGSIPDGLDDSKRVSEKRRKAFDIIIRQTAHISLGHATVSEIDALGIHVATRLAMTRAWLMLPRRGDELTIVDGNDIPEGIFGKAIAMVGADGGCPTVAAASIVAKVHRDAEMTATHPEADLYLWTKNKGYGTPAHLAALYEHGPTPYHRRSFDPLRSMIERNR